MDCWIARETMSADLDGEATIEEGSALRIHLTECDLCRTYEADLIQIHRSVRVRAVESVPNMVPSVLANARPPRVGRGGWIRYSLGLVAATNLALGLPDFLLRPVADGHDSRHLGAFTIAVSMGLLFAAIRPQRAYGLLPFAAALGFTMLIGAAVDTVQGGQSLLAERAHILDVAGLSLLWLLAGGRLPFARWSISPATHDHAAGSVNIRRSL